MCQHCKRYGKAVQATTVHHIKHADEYPNHITIDNIFLNLITRETRHITKRFTRQIIRFIQMS